MTSGPSSSPAVGIRATRSTRRGTRPRARRAAVAAVQLLVTERSVSWSTAPRAAPGRPAPLLHRRSVAGCGRPACCPPGASTSRRAIRDGRGSVEAYAVVSVPLTYLYGSALERAELKSDTKVREVAERFVRTGEWR